MRKFNLALCAFALSVASASALAATQGTVTFDGELQDETCTVSSGSTAIAVTLPTLSTQTLNAANTTGGSKSFDISVESCPSSITSVAAHFESAGGTGVNSSTGNLINTYGSDAATQTEPAATNVEIRLYNSDGNQLKVGETGNGFTVDTAGAATMRYYGGYYATAATTSGKVYAQTIYTLAYP